MKKRYVRFYTYGLLVTILVFLVVNSCAIQRAIQTTVNEITRVKYEGQSMEYMQEPVKVNRTGEFDIDAKDTTNAKYTVKIDKITLIDKSTTVLQDSFTKTIKIANLPPKIQFATDGNNITVGEKVIIIISL